MRHRKRGGDGGGGDHGDATVLGAVGLGALAQLDLHDPPEELPLAAAYDDASGCITVSLGGDTVSASSADLAAALELPRGAVGLALEADAAIFSSTEEIAAVGRFVRDRVLLGGAVDGVPESGEVAAALRLVEEGKAYEVDWGGLVWAMLKGEVVAGTPRRYAPYLLRLMEYQRPELFPEIDGRLPLRKRWKCQMLEQCQWTGEKLVVCEEHEVGEEEETLVYGISPNIGDLEEMPIFGEGKKVAVDVPVDCKRAFVEGEEIHGLSQGNADLGSQNSLPSDTKLLGHDMECDDGEGVARGNANNQSSADYSSFDRHLCTLDEQDDSSSPQQLIPGAKSQPGSNLQRIIEIEDKDDDKNNVGVGPSSHVIRNVPLYISPYLVQQHKGEGICNGQTLSPFDDYLQQILVRVLCMENGYLDKEKECRDTQAEVQRIKEMVMEKEHIIAATGNDILEELETRNIEMCRLEKDMKVMSCMAQQYKELLKKSLAKIHEYRNKMLCGEGVDSYLEVLGIAGEQSCAWVQQLHHHQQQQISRIQHTWFSYYLKLVKKITEVKTGMEDLNHELQRLKDSRSIPDLNKDVEHDGEGEASLNKMEDRDREGEEGRVSNTTHGGKHLGELIANLDQRNNTEESMDANGVQARCSEDEACHGGGASQGTS